MSHASSTIQCPNAACQARNVLSQRFCQQCQTFLPQRYLWAVGLITPPRPGELLGDRYQLIHSQVLLDTQPGLVPPAPSELPPMLEAYLRLSPYQLHVPQIYGLLPWGKGRSATLLVLLEQAPIYPAEARSLESETAIATTLMPSLTSLWPVSSPLRQLNWLWQIAQLWQPLNREQGVATLLNPHLLRVDGGCVRLLELEFDVAPPSLVQLGQFWQQALPATAAIAAFWQPLCQQLITAEICHPDQLLAMLDQGLAACSASQTRQVQIATRTDQGPTRTRNEDACYPPSGDQLTVPADTATIAIVCDGIGGHEGGNIASNLAINTITAQLKSLPRSVALATTMVAALDRATLAANDVICQRNDAEDRHDRQRMGTTLVMGLVNAHNLYINHAGDSRAYRITRTGCYQVTLDDDVAAREVRLGYALYRDALQQPAAGSLIQALGMNKSSFLHPTVQRFVLDEDCVWLLCSDGLSDYDRIEACWATEIVPLLDHQLDIATLSQRLVTVANTRNGHDNVTVGLIYCQVTAGTMPTLTAIALDHTAPGAVSTAAGTLPTQLLAAPRANSRWPLLLSLLGLAGATGLLAALWVTRSPAPRVVSSPAPSPSLAPPARPELTVGTLIQLERPVELSPADAGWLSLLRQAGVASTPATVLGNVATGSILHVVKQQGIANQGDWLQLKVCSTPDKLPSSPAAASLTAGAMGWQSAATIAAMTKANFAPTPQQIEACQAVSPALVNPK